MSDICAIRLQGHGYVVTPPRHVPVEPLGGSQSRVAVGEASSWHGTTGAAVVAAPSVTAAACIGQLDGCTVLNTFVHIRSVHEGARRRSQSVPQSFGSTRDDLATACHALRYRCVPVTPLNSECDVASETEISTLASSGCSREFFSSSSSDSSGENGSDEIVMAATGGDQRGRRLCSGM